ncbi:hypothetical protein ACQKC8_12500 [Stutzerimonas stutzeri]|uniref:hypothetical protein n=1 Tax=Stutzerimonas stutzeri TaxID=316 RepID=UPI003C2EE4B2
MNNDIRNALLDLFSVCLEVNGAGQYHAHMSYSAHINSVHVYVVPAATDYGDHSYTYTMEGRAYLDDELGGKPDEVVANLKALSDRVSEFLLPAQEEAA